MPLRSMTGFGRFQENSGDFAQTWEVRGVNGRFLDIKWKLPPEARNLEPRLEKLARRFAARGRVEIALNLQKRDRDCAPFDAAQAGAMLEALGRFAASRGEAFAPHYTALLHVPSLWTTASADEGDEERLFEQLSRGLEQALRDWNEARETEAAALAQDLRKRFSRMEQWVATIEARAPDIKTARFAQIRERLSEMLKSAGADLDEGRFLQEAVILADKLDVTEELTRLRAHLARLNALIEEGEDAGRKLDFTLQECFREINTCGNKIQDARLSGLVVECKNELEKCREQVQNLE